MKYCYLFVRGLYGDSWVVHNSSGPQYSISQITALGTFRPSTTSASRAEGTPLAPSNSTTRRRTHRWTNSWSNTWPYPTPDTRANTSAGVLEATPDSRLEPRGGDTIIEFARSGETQGT